MVVWRYRSGASYSGASYSGAGTLAIHTTEVR